MIYTILINLEYTPVIFGLHNSVKDVWLRVIMVYLNNKSDFLVPYIITSFIVNLVVSGFITYIQVEYFLNGTESVFPSKKVRYYVHMYIFNILANIIGNTLVICIPSVSLALVFTYVLMGAAVSLYISSNILISNKEAICRFRLEDKRISADSWSESSLVDGARDIRVYDGSRLLNINIWEWDDILIDENDNLYVYKDETLHHIDKNTPGLYIAFKDKKVVYNIELGKWKIEKEV